MGLFKKEKNDYIQPSKATKVMTLNKVLANKYVLISLVLIIDVLFFIGYQAFINVCVGIKMVFEQEMSFFSIFTAEHLLSVNWRLVRKYIYIYLAIIIIHNAFFIYQIRTNLGMEAFNKGQKGTRRWAIKKEIKEEYLTIDERDTPYEGMPGTVISCFDGKSYIDQDQVNNLYQGTTRSGKDENFIYKSIETYSRAEIKPSIVLTDIRLDMYPAAYALLTSRGYDCRLMNFIDPQKSIGNNELKPVVVEMKRGNIGDAELMCHSLCYSMFYADGVPTTGDQKFFLDTATQLTSAACLAHIFDCLDDDKRLNASRLEKWEDKQKYFASLNVMDKELAREKYCGTLKGLNKQEDILSKVDAIPIEEAFIPSTKNEKKINIPSVINAFTSLARQKINKEGDTLLDLYFEARPDGDRAKLLYTSTEVAGDKTKGNILSSALSKLLTYTYTNIQKMSVRETMNLEELGYGDKPIALFIGLPFYDHSKDFMVSMLMRQIFFINAKKSSSMPYSRCTRPIKHILNEFGNLPPIAEMDMMISAGLGAWISYDLYIQSDAQLEDKYGTAAATIKENCSNHFFIKSANENTTESFSRVLGNETITEANRMGHKLALDKTITETFGSHALLDANQLMDFMEGESAVMRFMKRRNLKKKKIRPMPIYNSVDTSMDFKARWEYMLDLFPQGKTINDVPYCQDEDIDMADYMWDWKRVLKLLENKVVTAGDEALRASKKEKEKVADTSEKTYGDLKGAALLHSYLSKTLGKDYQEQYNLHKDTSVADMETIIQDADISVAEKNNIFRMIGEGISNYGVVH